MALDRHDANSKNKGSEKMNTLTIGNSACAVGWAHTINGVSVPTSVNGIPGPQIYSINGVVR